MSGALLALRATIEADGGLLAAALRPEAEVAAAPAAHGAQVAQGPRAAGDPEAYAFVVEAIREGFLLHYASGRVLDDADADLALLAGDRLYALGLQRLAELGDLEAVEALADVIALSAQAQAAADDELVSAVWDAGLAQVGWGDDANLQGGRDAVRRGDPSAAHALRIAARSALSRASPTG